MATKYAYRNNLGEKLENAILERFDSCLIDDSTLVLSSGRTLRAYAFLEISRAHLGVLGKTKVDLALCLHNRHLSGSIEVRIETEKASPIFCLTGRREIGEEDYHGKQTQVRDLITWMRRKVEEFKGTYESIYEGFVELQTITDPREIARSFLRPRESGPDSKPESDLPLSANRRHGQVKSTVLQIVHSEYGILNTRPAIDKLSKIVTDGSLDLSIIYEPIDLTENRYPQRDGIDFFGERFREACRVGAWNCRLYLRLLEAEAGQDTLTISSLKSRIEACLSQQTSGENPRWTTSTREGSMRASEISDWRRVNREMLTREVEGLGEVLTSSELSCFLYPYDLENRRNYRLLSAPMRTPSQEELLDGREKGIPIGLILDCMERPVGSFEISRSQLRRHLCILGVTGSGKTTTGLILALELSKSKIPVVILDRTGEYTKTLPKFSPLAEVLVPGRDLAIPTFELDKGLNLGEQIEEWIDTIDDYIEVTWGEYLSPTQTRTLRLALEQCYNKRETLRISNLIRELRDPGEEMKRIKWWVESSESICSRIEIFATGRCGRVFDSEQSRLDPASLFQPFITIIDLSNFMDDRPKNLFSQLFSRRLEKHARKLGETTDLRLIYLIDEAQHIAPQRIASDRSSRMDIIERFAVELRKYGIGLVTMATRPTMISKNVLANSNTIINHCLFYEDDVKRMRETLGPIENDELAGNGLERCLRTLDPGEAVVRYGSYEAPFLVRIGTPMHREALREMLAG